ncbi:MAG: hypothetical protein LCH81_05225 [Bacteroidetes bacterium]|nr:hypothetical protein [Bacteroidota bacterium]
MRGGSWNNNPENCRASNRNNNRPNNRNNNIGFRVARDLHFCFQKGQSRCRFVWAAASVPMQVRGLSRSGRPHKVLPGKYVDRTAGLVCKHILAEHPPVLFSHFQKYFFRLRRKSKVKK